MYSTFGTMYFMQEYLLGIDDKTKCPSKILTLLLELVKTNTIQWNILMLTWIKRDIWLYIGFLSINIMYILYLNGSFLVTIEHMVKSLVWKRIKMTERNKVTNLWILEMQFCVDVVSIMIYVLMPVPVNPKWNSQLLITINHTSGFLFFFLYFHKFNGGFKYGSFFLSRFCFGCTGNSGGMFVYWGHVAAARGVAAVVGGICGTSSGFRVEWRDAGGLFLFFGIFLPVS